MPARAKLSDIIMEDFCLSVEDPTVSAALCRAIRGSGAFRRFKDAIHEYGIADEWYKHRNEKFREIAIEWCESHGIAYIDDRPPLGESSEAARGPSKKEKQYHHLAERLAALLEGERDQVADAANTAALLYHGLPQVNWAGFYFYRDGQLVLGPFQGRTACTRIAIGRGVCGKAAEARQTLVVEDVSRFPGHITCDSASKSEIVVPIVQGGRLIGVLDLDSPLIGRFDDEDRAGLERLVEIWIKAMA